VTTLRLDRLLANLGYGSRKDVAALVAAGRIRLDGAVVRDAAAHVPVGPELPARLTVDGAALDPPPGLLLLMHKPLGVTCSHKEAGPLVYDLLPPRWRRRTPAVSTVGRLDKDTSGLLLMTDDGGLLHRVIAPRSRIAKRYHVTLARPLAGDEGARLAAGTLRLEGEDTPLLPVAMTVLGEPTAAAPTVAVVLHEGRYHQVRRMFAALGNHVTALHRDRIGGLDLPADLAPGSYRVATSADTARIFTGEVG
jgi:16S rRNA pseudouridine516 synthase